MADKSKKILIAGIGNILKSDDGLGPVVIDQIRRLELPPHIGVIELGTPGLSILQYTEKYAKVIFIDAITKGGKPGSTYKVKLQDVVNETTSSNSETGDFLSMHEFNLEKTLAIGKALDQFQSDVVIIGCEPGDISTLRIGLTNDVREAVPKVIELVLKEVGMSKQFMSSERPLHNRTKSR